jgi:DMSO/TMAO reductase YedYZ molybdopterin-dependent catalytic subunit
MMLSRRRWLSLLAALPAAGWGAAKRDMIVRSARPEDLEMPLDGFMTWITPVERFFVRSHVYTPSVDPAAWRLTVEGEVASPLVLSLSDLKRLPRVELVSVLECAGNGRSQHSPRVIGLQWGSGAVGNARWAGVRLADVLKKAGIKPSTREVIANGADVPIGKMPDFIRGIPTAKTLHPDTLLAYEMNGAPLAPSHGFPLRLVVPGWAGDSWIKWVTHIQALDREFEGFWMKTGYRRPVRPVAPGAAVPPEAMEPVTSLRVKSTIAAPVPGETVSGNVRIRGAAWSGGAPIRSVEVSTDSGRTWRAARLGTEQAQYAWRLFEASWTPAAPGSYVLMSRATDADGETQPVVADWNPSGYSYNACPQVRVEVGASPGRPQPPAARPVPAFPPKVKAACLGCHGEDIIAGQRLTRAQWERDVQKMIGWGATVPPGDHAAILDFLVEHFGP